MIEIKFRVPVTHYETGEFNRFLYETLEKGIFMFNECMRDFPRELVIGKEEQFTGLYDKNGKEIYEGDVLKAIAPRGFIFRVFGVAGGFVINAFQDEITMLRFAEPIANMQTAGYIQEHCEVIGNIHENPELLND